MKTYELESFLKSFFMFFILLEILLAINFWYELQDKKNQEKQQIQVEMKLCAYTLQCNDLKTDFVKKDKDREENILYSDTDFYSYFKVPTVDKYLMKVTYAKSKYLDKIKKLEKKTYQKFLFYSLFAALVSLLFAIYTLMPLRKALHINEEFVKDILHDFNTPISSMLINSKLLRREIGKNKKIDRLENNIETILSLQDNLQVFLKGVPTQSESFGLNELVKNRVNYFQVLYPDITYGIFVEKTTLRTKKDALRRVLDNILSNAGKYNISNGDVFIVMKNGFLSIRDTGKGIKNPSKVFNRYYKEQDRGIGIGLHIVKKLCEEMDIKLKIESEEDRGTTIILDLSNIIA